jgi:hypothetical protein
VKVDGLSSTAGQTLARYCFDSSFDSNATCTCLYGGGPARTIAASDLRSMHCCGPPRTSRIYLGVRGSQVQILSSRQKKSRSQARYP